MLDKNGSFWSRLIQFRGLLNARLDRRKPPDTKFREEQTARGPRSPHELHAAGAGVPSLVSVEQQDIVLEAPPKFALTPVIR